jgi:putative ABC transport system permease protein
VNGLVFRIAGRELRAGVAGLWIVLACLALGVTAIAAVGTLRSSVAEGLARDGTRILGGDLSIDGGAQELPDRLRGWLRARQIIYSDVTTLRTMLVAPSGSRLLIELKAVDAAWPLIGAARMDPAQPVGTGLLVDPSVLERLGVVPGSELRLGNGPVKIDGQLLEEPDRVSTPTLFGPRVLVARATLMAAGLVQPGAIVSHQMRLKLPASANARSVLTALRTDFAEDGWRFREASDAAPGVGQFVDRMALFMTLVGLTSLLVGGIGVANGVRAWLTARARTIAILRCLGASAGLVFTIAMLQVLALAAAGVVIGLLAGGALPWLAGGFLRDVLPVPPVDGIYPRALAQAAAFGLLTAASFALWPLGRAMRIPGAALFRDNLAPDARGFTWRLLAANIVLALILVGLIVATAEDPKFALWFCAAAAATLAVFRLGGWGLMALARLTVGFGRRASVRLGLSNLYRPGAATALMLVSVGLGLSTLAAVALIQGNVRHQVAEQLPANAPSFFFIDIQNDQMAKFHSIIDGFPSVSEFRDVPSLRARVVSVNSIPVDQVHTTPDTAWALRGDRGLTYSATPPDGSRVVAGTWWPADYDGPPLVSFDAAIAAGWGVGIGDTIRLNVLGRNLDFKIANLRDVAWRTMGINFTLIASPGLLSRAPHTHIATLKVDVAAQADLLRAVTDALPNVSAIRVADVLGVVGAMLDQIATALAATGSLTLISGILVLAGAVAAGQRRRIRDAVILKTLGASRAQIRAAWLVEFGLIGAIAGILAAAIGTAASWGVVHFVMGTSWVFLPGTLAAVIIGCIALMLGLGYAGTASALRAKVAPMLRNE